MQRTFQYMGLWVFIIQSHGGKMPPFHTYLLSLSLLHPSSVDELLFIQNKNISICTVKCHEIGIWLIKVMQLPMLSILRFTANRIELTWCIPKIYLFVCLLLFFLPWWMQLQLIDLKWMKIKRIFQQKWKKDGLLSFSFSKYRDTKWKRMKQNNKN